MRNRTTFLVLENFSRAGFDTGWPIDKVNAQRHRLYAANYPVFIADFYARTLLEILGVCPGASYSRCQTVFEEGVARDFSTKDLLEILNEYTEDEQRYALCNSPRGREAKELGRVLLFQQFHAAIDEMGIAKCTAEIASELKDISSPLSGLESADSRTSADCNVVPNRVPPAQRGE